MIPSSTLTRRVGPISGLGLFSGNPAALTIAPGASPGFINFKSEGPPPRPFATARPRAVTYDAAWAGLPKGFPIRNTTLNASRPFAKDEPITDPPTLVMATVEHLLAALSGLGIHEACIT